MTGRILYIDAYDSFSNNIITLLKVQLSVDVETIKIDDSRFVLNDDAFRHFLTGFDAVVAGPGPGHPAKDADVGLIGKLWNLPEEAILPVLGICLGFQSLAVAFGASIERLREPRHGLVTRIIHCGQSLYAETGEIWATQYHSLHAVIEHSAAVREACLSSRKCPQLVPLACDLSDTANGPILMAIKHRDRPFFGVQYHPESICTNEDGRTLMASWWRDVEGWRTMRSAARALLNLSASRSLTGQALGDIQQGLAAESQKRSQAGIVPAGRVHWASVQLGGDTNVARIVEMLGDDGHEAILLESGTKFNRPVNPETGRFSIVALHDSSSKHIRWTANEQALRVQVGGQTLVYRLATIDEAFAYIEGFVQDRKAIGGPTDSPFWGGLMGFVSYEAGLDTIGVTPAFSERPDIWYVFCERSVVIDHAAGIAYVQSLQAGDRSWLQNTTQRLRQVGGFAQVHLKNDIPPEDAMLLCGPDKVSYCQKVRECQAHLRSGSSYELCLTDQTLIHSNAQAWDLYLRLRTLNPAPFAAFMQLRSAAHSLEVISSSPERFLSWSRERKCQFRPIKGTVKKGPGMTRAKAEIMLGSAKECAENLMIVDLIRHDLSGVSGYVCSILRCPPELL